MKVKFYSVLDLRSLNCSYKVITLGDFEVNNGREVLKYGRYRDITKKSYRPDFDQNGLSLIGTLHKMILYICTYLHCVNVVCKINDIFTSE